MKSRTPGPVKALIAGYRRTGADLPFGDPTRSHAVSMEGYYWRFTDPVDHRVIIALVGLNRPRKGGPWATLGIAAQPGGHLATAAVPGGADSMSGLRVTVPGHVEADPANLVFRLAGADLRVRLTGVRAWPRRAFGGSSYFQLVPSTGTRGCCKPPQPAQSSWVTAGSASTGGTPTGRRTGDGAASRTPGGGVRRTASPNLRRDWLSRAGG